MLAVALAVLAAGPCTERACFITAAEKCAATKGSLPIVDWTGMFGVDAKGRTEITVKPGEAGACVVTLDLVVTDFKPKTDIPRQKAIDRLNASARYHLKCTAPGAELANMLTVIGTTDAKLSTFFSCKPTRCAPVPPLDEGCLAGVCKDGEYAITCGKRACSMSGIEKEALADGMVYACGDDAGEIRTRMRR